MAKKSPQVGAWFIRERTRSLAVVYLTRRDDLLVTEAAEDGVDLDVVIKTRNGALNRKFGVILKGTLHRSLAGHLNTILKATIKALSDRKFPYPVCFFQFGMENDSGYYTWVAEPIVTPEGNPVLQPCNSAKFAELDSTAINHIVASVNAWYDAFYDKVMEGTNGHRKPNGVEVLHSIIDGEAAYFSKHGESPQLLKLPILQAYELAKLGREHLGDLAGHIIKDGVRVLEKDGLLGMKVKLVTDQQEFSFE